MYCGEDCCRDKPVTMYRYRAPFTLQKESIQCSLGVMYTKQRLYILGIPGRVTCSCEPESWALHAISGCP